MPVISVSQKPIDLGMNICVGDVGVCDLNTMRQLQIGIEAAKTDFIIVGEADCLYPPEYFAWEPEEKDVCFRYPNVYILHKWIGTKWGGGFRRKPHFEGAMICGREHWLRQLDVVLRGQPDWFRPPKDKSGNWHGTTPDMKREFDTFKVGWGTPNPNPVITLKTGDGQRKYTYWAKGEEAVDDIPYWGKASDLRRELFD